MKRSLLLLSLLFAVVSSVVGQVGGVGPGEPVSRRYTVKDEEFSVTLPLLPIMMRTNVARKSDGKVRLETRLKTSFAGVNYTIESFENPEPKQSLAQFVE